MKFCCQGHKTTMTVEQLSPEFSDAMRELEDKHNMNMSVIWFCMVVNQWPQRGVEVSQFIDTHFLCT